MPIRADFMIGFQKTVIKLLYVLCQSECCIWHGSFKPCCTQKLFGVLAILSAVGLSDCSFSEWIFLQGEQLCHFHFCLPFNAGQLIKERI